MTHNHAPDTDMVLVERSLIGAACHAIEKKRDAPNLLEKLRAVTMAAGRADAVPGLDVVLRERGLPRVADALGYSRNFSAANPALSQTTRDHIEGLCNMLEIAAQHPAPQQMTTQGEAVAIVGERGSVSWRSETILPVGTKLYAGSQP